MRAGLSIVLPLLALGALGGCSRAVDTRGYVIRESALAQLTPGVTTQDAVQQVMGSPSSVAAFDDKTWYYIGQTEETVSFFKPSVVERHVLMVKFDQSGVLQSSRMLDQSATKEVQMVARETPTAGNELTFMQQMLGNVGRFSRPTDANQGR
jgi:outer membrane protein assembly factor BamE (lipoprotein component of BamABCDE complex)